MMTAPAAYVQIAREESARWGAWYGVTVPLPLVLAVMQKENPRFDTAARFREADGEYSHGLMMVKDSTARMLGLRTVESLHVPRIGIGYGVKYLTQQFKRYGGDLERTVAAYNAGSAKRNRAGLWINQTYVNEVLRFMRGAAFAVPAVALVAGAALAWFLSRRQRAA